MPGAPYSRVRAADRSARDYVVHRTDGRLVYAPLPAVQLSFADTDDSVYFTDRAVHSADAFSPFFARFYDANVSNVATVFAAVGKGYDGPRRLPVTFRKGRRAGTWPFASRPRVYADPYDAPTAASETASIDARTTHVPRSTRQVMLLHWVTSKPEVWTRAQPTDFYYTHQWLDTHSHPGWFYPTAALPRVLLLIRAPHGTPMLRIPRHSPQAHRINRLASGEWTHHEANPTSSEVRLPPGRFLVEMPPRKERYAGLDVLVVRLVYEAGRF